MFVVETTTAEWIGVLATVAFGIIGVLFAAAQWQGGGFRPKFTARIDQKRQGMELTIVNRGRGAGVIHRVAVTCPTKHGSQIVTDADFVGFEGGDFAPLALSPASAARLIVNAVDKEPFDPKAGLKVEWGHGKKKELKPLPVDVGIYGLESMLPPKGQ